MLFQDLKNEEYTNDMPDIYVPRNLGDSSSTCRKYLKVSSRIAWTFYIVVTGLCILSKLLG